MTFQQRKKKSRHPQNDVWWRVVARWFLSVGCNNTTALKCVIVVPKEAQILNNEFNIFAKKKYNCVTQKNSAGIDVTCLCVCEGQFNDYTNWTKLNQFDWIRLVFLCYLILLATANMTWT